MRPAKGLRMRVPEEIMRVLHETWMKDKELIDKALARAIEQLPESLAVDAARYIVMGGKRFRGFLVVEIAKCLGANPEDALDAAVAVELIHSSSLALDDIIDVDIERRGRRAAWVEYGVRKTVMAVYLLVTYAHKIVEKAYGALAASRTIDATFNISRGEVMDSFANLDSMSADFYEKLIELKTASLFRLAAELGAIAAGRPQLVSNAGEYGKLLGMIYQISDDLVDSLNGEDTPVIRLFKRWLGDEGYDKAYKTIASYIIQSQKIADTLTIKCKSVLRYLPLFIAEGMLKDRTANIMPYIQI